MSQQFDDISSDDNSEVVNSELTIDSVVQSHANKLHTEFIITLDDSEDEPVGNKSAHDVDEMDEDIPVGVESGSAEDISKKNKRKPHTLEFKLKVINYIKSQNPRNVSQTAREFNIHRKLVTSWEKMEDKIRKELQNRSSTIRVRNKISHPRNPQYPDIDKQVIEWIREQRSKGLAVNTEAIKSKALEASSSLNPRPVTTFKASNGWLHRFLGRNKLKSRVATSVGQKIPVDAKIISQEFFRRIDNFRNDNKNNEFHIMNMDEMPMYFDSPFSRTFDQIGSQTVKLKTTGSEKLRFTLILCAYSDGRKCKPAIIFNGLKNKPKVKFPTGIEIMVADKGSANEKLMKEWTQLVYRSRHGGVFYNTHMKTPNGPKYRTLLTMDSATPHRGSEFKNNMAKNYDTKVEIIPGGMTPLLQPADVSWNKSVKSKVKHLWTEWMAGPKSPEELNKSDQPKRPSYVKVAEWCLQAWKELDRQLIINSFEYCNCGKVRNDDGVHQKLKDIINDNSDNEDMPEATGLTDNESETEEAFESVDFD